MLQAIAQTLNDFPKLPLFCDLPLHIHALGNVTLIRWHGVKVCQQLYNAPVAMNTNTASLFSYKSITVYVPQSRPEVTAMTSDHTYY